MEEMFMSRMLKSEAMHGAAGSRGCTRVWTNCSPATLSRDEWLGKKKRLLGRGVECNR
jgi:hypothetical protein